MDLEKTIEKMKIHSKEIRLVSAVLVLLLSLFLLHPILTNPHTYRYMNNELDREKNAVKSLLAGSSSASIAVTLIPDDVGTPIAQELAELSDVFILILSILFTEKYLMIIFSEISTLILIPSLCIMYIIHLFMDSKRLKQVMIKVLALVCALLFIIPAGVRCSSLINRVFEDSINRSIQSAIEPEKLGNETVTTSDETNDKSIWQQAADWITNAADTVVNAASEAVEWAKTVLNNFIEATAVMIVTCCVIPIVMFVLFLSVIRRLFNLTFVPKMKDIKEIVDTQHHLDKPQTET